MANQKHSNSSNQNDIPKKIDKGDMTDVPAFIVQGSSSSSMANMPEHLTPSQDRHQKQQAQQQQEHQQKQAVKNTEKKDVDQQGDASSEQIKQQQQDDKYEQDNSAKDQNQNKKNKPSTQRQPNQQQQAQPQQQSTEAADYFKGKWQQHVGAAKVVWGKLTDDELLQSEGKAQKLVGLVQERYAISRAEADKQVKAFIEKCKC